MKAGGVTAVATYVIWIHHEEVEGRVRFDGDRDLRRFAELCARHGLDLVPRIGPWAHAEVRNGGSAGLGPGPRRRPPHRRPAPTWTPYVPGSTAIAGQLPGPGPGPRRPDRRHPDRERAVRPAGPSAHAEADGPGGRPVGARCGRRRPGAGCGCPPDELLPLYGGYTETFWTEADGGWPDTCRKHFFFTHQRDDEGIGADLRADDGTRRRSGRHRRADSPGPPASWAAAWRWPTTAGRASTPPTSARSASPRSAADRSGRATTCSTAAPTRRASSPPSRSPTPPATPTTSPS